ncbi:M28 family metallopeptidase [Seonamhaeicola maritimus]|uniref:M28 family peptidase n=1 Tax=Seonamhaeicola maritimus TaxID=2591822 RepID=A0A5C7GF13_9FLAO|nr:M28 family metallopeptidase [Seonamhaeicola maritimus]TXG35736.1 M28 family peptidase [Seonamhaeicola maritimus]
MKTFCILTVLTLLGTCATPKYTTKIQNLKDSIQLVDSINVVKYANTITTEELKKHLYLFSSDDFEGREAGEKGHIMAADFLKSYYQNEKIESAYGADNYFQTIPADFFPHHDKSSDNVLAFIEGSEKPDEVIVISAHLDHLGIEDDGQINNGADDDGSGTVAIMEMAQAFNKAKQEGNGPKRSILFLHFTAEELGKKGSEYYTMYPAFPIENTVADLNIDMIGRIDDLHQDNKDYIYLIGSDRLSKELHYISEKVNETFFNINIDYRYNVEGERNNYYSRSDHYHFATKGVPVIFYFNGEHADYHRPSDTPDKIDYPLLQKRARLVFATAWQLANQEHRVILDKNNELLK